MVMFLLKREYRPRKRKIMNPFRFGLPPVIYDLESVDFVPTMETLPATEYRDKIRPTLSSRLFYIQNCVSTTAPLI